MNRTSYFLTVKIQVQYCDEMENIQRIGENMD